MTQLFLQLKVKFIHLCSCNRALLNMLIIKSNSIMIFVMKISGRCFAVIKQYECTAVGEALKHRRGSVE